MCVCVCVYVCFECVIENCVCLFIIIILFYFFIITRGFSLYINIYICLFIYFLSYCIALKYCNYYYYYYYVTCSWREIEEWDSERDRDKGSEWERKRKRESTCQWRGDLCVLSSFLSSSIHQCYLCFVLSFLFGK